MNIASGARPRFASCQTWLIRQSLVAAAAMIAPVAAQTTRVSNLNNIGFGTVSVMDQKKADNVCVYVNSATKNYTILATGSGNGGAFALQSGSSDLPYSFQWADTAAQTSGTAITSGTTSPMFNTTATANGCSTGPTTTATDIFLLSAANVSAALAGTYSGTLSLTITPQ